MIDEELLKAQKRIVMLQEKLKETKAKLKEIDALREMWHTRALKLGWHKE